MSVCCKRLIYWLLLTTTTVGGGITADLILKTRPFPIFVRALGLIGMISAHFLLKRSGRVLRLLGEPKGWGCTSRLVTTDIYRCVRHPHHLGIGIFMTSLGLAIGHPCSFLIITLSQWAWVIWFLFTIEERELREKFGEEYEAYSREVPMLLPKLSCVFKLLFGKRPSVGDD